MCLRSTSRLSGRARPTATSRGPSRTTCSGVRACAVCACVCVCVCARLWRHAGVQRCMGSLCYARHARCHAFETAIPGASCACVFDSRDTRPSPCVAVEHRPPTGLRCCAWRAWRRRSTCPSSATGARGGGAAHNMAVCCAHACMHACCCSCRWRPWRHPAEASKSTHVCACAPG
jgi:hypothetical protein